MDPNAEPRQLAPAPTTAQAQTGEHTAFSELPMPTAVVGNDSAQSTGPVAVPASTSKHRPLHALSFLNHLGHLGLDALTKVVPVVAKVAEAIEPEFDLLFPLEGPIYNSVVRAICVVEMASNKNTSGETKLQSVTSLVSPHLGTFAAHYSLSDQELEVAIHKYVNGVVGILNGPVRSSSAFGPTSEPTPIPETLLASEPGSDEGEPPVQVGQQSSLGEAVHSLGAMAEQTFSHGIEQPVPQAPADPQPAYPCTIIDISHCNGSVDLSHAVANGIFGVIHKATQGCLFRDPAYLLTRPKAKAAGLLWGAYHFGTDEDGETQAKHFLETVNPSSEDILVLDLEVNRLGPSMTLDQARTFVQSVQQQTGRWPGIYGGYYLKHLLAGKPDRVLAYCWLWLSQYDDKPRVPSNWSTWKLWQYTDGAVGIPSKPLPGVGICDRSFFNGPPEDLNNLWKQGTLA
ncbi:MAG: glycoside hydrolase family 25 [Edaphobacter sp.]|nr:glycoside hydrolase family 25 [Edaphobacter sp.]